MYIYIYINVYIYIYSGDSMSSFRTVCRCLVFSAENAASSILRSARFFSLAEDVRLAAVSTGRGGKNMGDAGKSLQHSCDPKQ